MFTRITLTLTTVLCLAACSTQTEEKAAGTSVATAGDTTTTVASPNGKTATSQPSGNDSSASPASTPASDSSAATEPTSRPATPKAGAGSSTADGSSTGSSSPGKQVTLSDAERTTLAGSLHTSMAGMITPTEARCWVDSAAAAGLTKSQFATWSADAMSGGNPLVQQAMGKCLDKTVKINIGLVGQFRESFIAGVQREGITKEQATCFADGLTNEGLTGRDMIIALLNPDDSAEFKAAARRVFDGCAGTDG